MDSFHFLLKRAHHRSLAFARQQLRPFASTGITPGRFDFLYAIYRRGDHSYSSDVRIALGCVASNITRYAKDTEKLGLLEVHEGHRVLFILTERGISLIERILACTRKTIETFTAECVEVRAPSLTNNAGESSLNGSHPVNEQRRGGESLLDGDPCESNQKGGEGTGEGSFDRREDYASLDNDQLGHSSADVRESYAGDDPIADDSPRSSPHGDTEEFQEDQWLRQQRRRLPFVMRFESAHSDRHETKEFKTISTRVRKRMREIIVPKIAREDLLGSLQRIRAVFRDVRLLDIYDPDFRKHQDDFSYLMLYQGRTDFVRHPLTRAEIREGIRMAIV